MVAVLYYHDGNYSYPEGGKNMSGLMRMGEIEKELGVQSWRIRHAIKAEKLRPECRIGNIDLYGRPAVDALKARFNKREATR